MPERCSRDAPDAPSNSRPTLRRPSPRSFSKHRKASKEVFLRRLQKIADNIQKLRKIGVTYRHHVADRFDYFWVSIHELSICSSSAVDYEMANPPQSFH